MIGKAGEEVGQVRSGIGLIRTVTRWGIGDDRCCNGLAIVAGRLGPVWGREGAELGLNRWGLLLPRWAGGIGCGGGRKGQQQWSQAAIAKLGGAGLRRLWIGGA
ncbi:unnamed protein product [Cuscuta europaea]|uniref:Uncharacterized protein n=1 Tax=Cuscuta europaea TaxID=41803 RepID=A0A9P0ZEV3_CUSEU|nr:unnamed protein product [Cuscuta europaea]